MNIVIVDEQEESHARIADALHFQGLNCNCILSKDTSSLFTALQNNKVDIILFAIHSKSISGFHALEISNSLSLRVPFIVLCDTGVEEEIIDLMKAGADDYVLFGDIRRLFYSIRAMINKYEFIREKQKLDQTIIESEKAYRLLAENLTDMITRHDLRGVYNYVSASSYSLLGFLPEELIGKLSLDFLHPDDRERIEKEYRAFIASGEGVYTASYRYRSQQGKYIWIESTNKFTYGTDAVPDGIISTSRDISDRKNFELKLEEKIRELDTFIYRSSHDLKGPLASLQGLINVAKTEIKDATSLQYFAMVDRSVKHLDTLLMDLLNITRIAQGSLNLVSIDLNDTIISSIKSFDHLPFYTEIDWRLELENQVNVVLDKALLNNIVHNLIINAIKYHDKAKPNPYIRVVLKDIGDYIDLRIEDNGEGIPEELQMHVFDMFFRGNTRSSGTGLGLYIVKNAVEKMGGSIALQSNHGEGSKFQITLPKNLPNL
jgi:PAS domain S-box-containing protein